MNLKFDFFLTLIDLVKLHCSMICFDTVRVPVIFEGDLAHTANCHLKKNDRVYITGQIFVDVSEIAGAKPDQSYVHVSI